MSRIAVIDTETNFDDEVMSVGIAIGEEGSYILKDTLYIVVSPAYQKPSLYGGVLAAEKPDGVGSYADTLRACRSFLQKHEVTKVFAYNARFDYHHLPQLRDYAWFDIMRLAAYRQYNPAIPACADCCSTGKLRRGYRAEDIYRMLSRDIYFEKHNALTDAVDELAIMRMLRHPTEVYEIGRIK